MFKKLISGITKKKEKKRAEELAKEQHKTELLKQKIERRKLFRQDELDDSSKEATKNLDTLKIEGIREENVGKLIAYLAMNGDEKSKDVLIGTLKIRNEKLLEDANLVKENEKLLKAVNSKTKEIETLKENSEMERKLKDFENQILNIKADPSISNDTKDQLLQKLYNENPDHFEEIQKIVGKINAS